MIQLSKVKRVFLLGTLFVLLFWHVSQQAIGVAKHNRVLNGAWGSNAYGLIASSVNDLTLRKIRFGADGTKLQGLSVSPSGTLMAVELNNGVNIYRDRAQANPSLISSTLITRLNGWVPVAWSPNSQQLLLIPESFGGIAIWDARTNSVHQYLASLSICSGDWMLNSSTLLLSICYGTRRLIEWSPYTNRIVTKVGFDFEIDKEWTIFASAVTRNPDKNSFLIEVRMGSAPVRQTASLPVLPERRLFTMDGQTAKLTPISATYMDTTNLWLNTNKLAVLKVVDTGYRQLELWDNSVRSWTRLKLENQDCLRKIGVFDHAGLLLEYAGCKNPIADGYFLYKIDKAGDPSALTRMALTSQ